MSGQDTSVVPCKTSGATTIFQRNGKRAPGILVTGLLAWLSIWLADYTGTDLMGFEKSPVSAVMIALLLGMVIGNVLTLPDTLKPGIAFCVKQVLRIGIILLGIRLSVFDVFQLGLIGLPIVVICIISALVFTAWLSKRLNLPEKLGILIAVGTSICGVTAILATGPSVDANDKDVAYAVAVITIFGLVATLLYPFLADFIFESDATRAGLFLGTAIHDTSQVTGAGLVFSETFDSPRALDVATVTKMVRNVLMVIIIPLMAFRYKRENASNQPGRTTITQLFPLFILGFITVAVLRSVGDAGLEAGRDAFWIWDTNQWQSLHVFIKDCAVILLVVALAGVGLTLQLDIFRGLGIKPFLAGLGAAVTVGLVSILTISILGSFVTF